MGLGHSIVNGRILDSNSFESNMTCEGGTTFAKKAKYSQFTVIETDQNENVNCIAAPPFWPGSKLQSAIE